MIIVILAEALGSRRSKADVPEETADQIMEHVSVSYDAGKHITWYIPKHDTPEAETWIYASLGVRDEGERRLVLNIQRVNGGLWFARSLHIETNGTPLDIHLDPARHRIDGRSIPEGIEETLLMDDQEIVIRGIAKATKASITILAEKQKWEQFNLRQKDLTNFLRIVTLYDTATIPGPREGDDHGGEQDRRTSDRSRVITNPRLIENTRKLPTYPQRARRAGVQGLVILYAVVHKDGTVGDLRVARTPADGLGFEKAALKAVREWRYEPGLLNGEPVDVTFAIIIDFYFKH